MVLNCPTLKRKKTKEPILASMTALCKKRRYKRPRGYARKIYVWL